MVTATGSHAPPVWENFDNYSVECGCGEWKHRSSPIEVETKHHKSQGASHFVSSSVHGRIYDMTMTATEGAAPTYCYYFARSPCREVNSSVNANSVNANSVNANNVNATNVKVEVKVKTKVKVEEVYVKVLLLSPSSSRVLHIHICMYDNLGAALNVAP